MLPPPGSKGFLSTMGCAIVDIRSEHFWGVWEDINSRTQVESHVQSDVCHTYTEARSLSGNGPLLCRHVFQWQLLKYS